jgi:hypothetical protein
MRAMMQNVPLKRNADFSVVSGPLFYAAEKPENLPRAAKMAGRVEP